MHGFDTPRRLVVAITAAVVLVMGGAVWAYPVLSANSFALTSGSSETLYSGAATDLGVRVSTTSGVVTVEHNNGAWVILGQVQAGQAAVFEGTYSEVRVRANSGSAAGTYEVRDLTASSPAEGIIGSGECAVSSTPVRVFRGGASAYRWITIVAGTGEISVRTSRGGSDLITVSPGNSANCDFETSEYWVVGTGTIAFDVKAVDPQPQNPFSEGDASSTGSDSTVEVSKGSTAVCKEIVIENTGKGKVTVKWSTKAGAAGGKSSAQPDVDIAKGNSASFDCHIDSLVVVFEKDQGKIHWKKRKF